MLRDLKGQKVFLTGASRGIGKAIAIKLAKEGASLCLTDICDTKESTEALENVVSDCKEYGVHVTSVAADALDIESFKSALDTAVKELGGISILVSNGRLFSFSKNK